MYDLSCIVMVVCFSDIFFSNVAFGIPLMRLRCLIQLSRKDKKLWTITLKANLAVTILKIFPILFQF